MTSVPAYPVQEISGVEEFGLSRPSAVVTTVSPPKYAGRAGRVSKNSS